MTQLAILPGDRMIVPLVFPSNAGCARNHTIMAKKRSDFAYRGAGSLRRMGRKGRRLSEVA